MSFGESLIYGIATPIVTIIGFYFIAAILSSLINRDIIHTTRNKSQRLIIVAYVLGFFFARLTDPDISFWGSLLGHLIAFVPVYRLGTVFLKNNAHVCPHCQEWNSQKRIRTLGSVEKGSYEYITSLYQCKACGNEYKQGVWLKK